MNKLSANDNRMVIARMKSWSLEKIHRFEQQWNCPTCDAVPGQKCRTVTARSTPITTCHLPRRRLAWEDLAETLRGESVS